jgi:hypothetical protein
MSDLINEFTVRKFIAQYHAWAGAAHAGIDLLIAISDRLWDPAEIETEFSTAKTQPEKAQPRRKAAGALKQNPSTPAAVKRRLARKASADMDRSAHFQSVVNAAVRAGMTPDQLEAEMRQYPDGCVGKYLESGDRLRAEIDRSYAKAQSVDDETTNAVEKEPARPHTLTEVRAVFNRWFGTEYDLGVLNAVLAVVAAEKLSGDPPWLLTVGGPGNAKTETIQAASDLSARVVSTITSEGARYSQRHHARAAPKVLPVGCYARSANNSICGANR